MSAGSPGSGIPPAQHPAVTGVGHPEPLPQQREPERPVQRRCRALPARVRLNRTRIYLSENDIGCRVAAPRHLVPHQDAVMPRVGHYQTSADDGDSGGEVHPPLGTPPARGPPFRRPVGLTEHHIGWLLIALGHTVPDQHSMVAGVRHHDMRVVDEHPARRIHPGHARGRLRQRQPAGRGRAQPGPRLPSTTVLIGQHGKRAGRTRPSACTAIHAVAHGVPAHGPTRTQTSPSSTRSGSCSSCTPGADRHSPDDAS